MMPTPQSRALVRSKVALLNDSFEFQKILLKGLKQYGTPNIKVLSPNTNTVSSAVYNGIAAGFSNRFSKPNSTLRYIPIRNTPKFHLSLVSNCEMDKNKLKKLAEIIKQQLH